jgi:hypothetical protein
MTKTEWVKAKWQPCSKHHAELLVFTVSLSSFVHCYSPSQQARDMEDTLHSSLLYPDIQSIIKTFETHC